MVQPKVSPVSLRLGPGRQVAIAAYAAAKKITPHAAMLALIDIGLGAPPQTIARLASPGLPTPERQAEIKAEAVRRQAGSGHVNRLKGVWSPK